MCLNFRKVQPLRIIVIAIDISNDRGWFNEVHKKNYDYSLKFTFNSVRPPTLRSLYTNFAHSFACVD